MYYDFSRAKIKNRKKMSRTWRNPSHRIKKYKKLKKVRDGSVTHVSHFCENHGGCPYCERNRFYQYLKQPSLEEALKISFIDD